MFTQSPTSRPAVFLAIIICIGVLTPVPVPAGASERTGDRPAAESLDRLFSSKPLGCEVGASATSFRVFAPRATRVVLAVFDQHDAPTGVEHEMARDEQGVWEHEMPGRMFGKYYGYRIDGPKGPGEMFDPNVVVADPYSKAVATRNSWRHPGKTLILDTSYDWEGDSFIAPGDHSSLVIYEAHLRDTTAHPSSGVRERGTYRGMVEPGGPGGLAHLKHLGINAVEFLPLHDFGNIELPYKDPATESAGYPLNTWNPYERNHWGYMTSYFFAPESYYASGGSMRRDRYSGADGRAVREMKDMVKALHREGIVVILDVVYNHVSQYDYNPFKFIDKQYYFHLDEKGNFRSDSGTGNDFKTERPMSRRMIVDSIRYWMTEYHVDGFRFDLAAMIDKETLEAIRDEARKINPNVILIAEPWGGGKYDPAAMSKIGWAAWNDRIRNGVKGRNPRGPVPADGPGFIFGRHEGKNTAADLRSFVTGTLAEDGGLFARASHSVNYLESHDDNTMGDYIRFVTGKVKEHQKITNRDRHARLSPAELRLHKLAAAFLMTARGPVMIHQGQEFGRSKVIAPSRIPGTKVNQIDDNSYEKDDETNYVNYNHARMNEELVDYYRGLIALRKKFPGIGSGDKTGVTFVDTGSEFVLAWRLEDRAGNTFFVVLNGQPHAPAAVSLPAGAWRVLANARAADPSGRLGSVKSRAVVPASSPLVLQAIRR